MSGAQSYDHHSNHTDHAQLQKEVARMSWAAMEYALRDCRDAMSANPENPKFNHYADMVCYISMRMMDARMAEIKKGARA